MPFILWTWLNLDRAILVWLIYRHLIYPVWLYPGYATGVIFSRLFLAPPYGVCLAILWLRPSLASVPLLTIHYSYHTIPSGLIWEVLLRWWASRLLCQVGSRRKTSGCYDNAVCWVIADSVFREFISVAVPSSSCFAFCKFLYQHSPSRIKRPPNVANDTPA